MPYRLRYAARRKTCNKLEPRVLCWNLQYLIKNFMTQNLSPKVICSWQWAIYPYKSIRKAIQSYKFCMKYHRNDIYLWSSPTLICSWVRDIYVYIKNKKIYIKLELKAISLKVSANYQSKLSFRINMLSWGIICPWHRAIHMYQIMRKSVKNQNCKGLS